MYYLGYDIGSSSIKAALLDGSTNRPVAVVKEPAAEMAIQSPQPGWAEQEPSLWWEMVVAATQALWRETGVHPSLVAGIGIAYQMHGLVLIDKRGQVLRPAIIWSDSRAVAIGQAAFAALGAERCMERLLNSPGNFTASKLRWVQENEPEVFQRIYRLLLPGDYIAYQLTGEATTTIAGLSEGMFWDFRAQRPADFLLDYYGIPTDLLPRRVPVFGEQGRLQPVAAEALGLPAGIPVAYRAGDQPNNALALGALEPGEVAATGGTSGVVFSVSDQLIGDPQQRVNTFAHVNYQPDAPRTGLLLNINGAGILYRYVRSLIGWEDRPYAQLEEMVEAVAIGADGLVVLPFGNGAERMLENRTLGAQVLGLDFNRHGKPHFLRAALEGIAFAFVYGMEQLNVPPTKLRVGNDNLFQSAVFSTTIATLTNTPIEVVSTTGAIGAARGAAHGLGQFATLREAVSGDPVVQTFYPIERVDVYQEAYHRWKAALLQQLENQPPHVL